jgi:multidrug efflux pump
MIGETTLAMLYVPLFFYLFDQLTEKLEERKKAKAKAKEGAGTTGPPAGEVPPKESGGGLT